MQIGLLGKANVGKSTFFSAATETVVQTGNFPFTTIEPNVGVTHVKVDCACKSLQKRCGNNLCVDGTRFIPIKLIDVAGLVPGAHDGKGLGNQFLTDAMKADALIHVVDISGSTDIQGQPVTVGTHDPLEDIKFVEDEFDLWFKQLLDREWYKLTKEIEQKRAKISDGLARRFTGLGIKESDIDQVLNSMSLKLKKPTDWSDDEIMKFLKSLRKIAKPMKTVVVRPGNLYGPYDKFDWEKSKVIPALIRRAVERQNPFAVWGDGMDLKDFLYVDDYVEGMLLAMEKMEAFQPINIASGMPVTIREVLAAILSAADYKNAKVEYDTTKPTGARRP